MSGLFGPTNGQTASFDFSILSDYYAAKSQAKLATATPTATKAKTADTVSYAPWDQKSATTASAVSKLRDALTATSFVDLRDSAFENSAVSQDQRKLFSLYVGLQRLQAIANRAGEDNTSTFELTGLTRRFQSGMTEIKNYLTNNTFEDLTMLFGTRTSKADSALRIPRPPTLYTAPGIVTGASSNVISGISASDVFTVSIAKAGGTTDITMDMSEISGDLSLDNVLVYMNGKLEAAGVQTRFTRTIYDGKTSTDPKKYGLGIQTVATERMSLAAAASEPAIYVGGVAGSGTTQSGQLIKFSDDGASVSSNFTADITPATGVSDIRATTTDADGNVYVVGNATGDLGSGVVQGAQDVYLRKYDAAGKLVWSRLLGSSERASGYALAADANGNVAIAGKVSDRLTSTAIGGGDDTFVTKFDSQGREVFTRQIAPVTNDQANALAFGADGSLYVAGQTNSAMSASVTHGGGSDAYLMKLSPSGSLQYVRQFGGADDDRATALAVDDNGDVVIGTVEGGEAKVRKVLSTDGTSSPVWEVSLGALGQGQLSSLAVENGNVYVGGSTTNASLDAGGAASIATAHSGGSDAFVMKITDSGPTASADFVTYVGTSGSDSGTGIAVHDGEIYVTGSTNGSLSGGVSPTNTNAYLAKLDENGARVWAHQYESTKGAASGQSIAVDASGSSVLDRLGLPRGTITFDETRLITAQSSLRAGDFFYVKVNDNAAMKITVAAGDTMRSLTTKINSALLLKGEATLTRSGGDGVRITASEGNVIELIRGTGAYDALEGLGLQPGKLDNTSETSTESKDKKDINFFALGLDASANLNDKTSAKALYYQLESALQTIQSAYSALTKPAGKTANSAASAAAMQSYQSILAMLGG